MENMRREARFACWYMDMDQEHGTLHRFMAKTIQNLNFNAHHTEFLKLGPLVVSYLDPDLSCW